MSKYKILFQLSGSIACFKAGDLISKLIKEGHEVQTVASNAALQFLGPATLEGLTGRRVMHDLFEPGQMMSHIELERWADVIVLYPASADAVARMASGRSDDLISSLFLTHEFKKPFLVAPAMNQAMWKHPATQRNVKTIASWGATICGPDDGLLACGEIGGGRLIEPAEMLKKLHEALEPSQKTVLLTMGGTSEPIDDVRSITNFSSGATGKLIAETLSARGVKVDVLCAVSAPPPESVRLVKRFESTDDLCEKVKAQLTSTRYDAVIHLAAVSDYRVRALADQRGNALDRSKKLSSQHDELVLTLEKTPKIIDEMGAWLNPETQLIAFKLTMKASESDVQKKVSELSERTAAALIVQNDLSEISQEQHIFKIYRRRVLKPIVVGNTKAELADALYQLIEGNVP